MQEWFNIRKSIHVMQHLNKIEDKSHMIISIQKKPLIKFNILFMIKALKKLETEGKYLSIIKYV
jgi:hypothetical protein